MTRRLLRARRVIDGAGGMIEHGAMLVADAQIEAVGLSVDVGEPSDVEVLELVVAGPPAVDRTPAIHVPPAHR